MTVWSHLSTIFVRRHIFPIICWLILIVVLFTALWFAPTANAAPSSQTLSFSARLKKSSGGVVSDGYYNISFSIYGQESNGSALWTEAHVDSNGPATGNDERLQVTNGYFSARLGSLNSFPSSIDWSQDLWLSMNVAGTEHVVPASLTWDGEMTPRIQLAAVPTAMNANAVGGKAADQLVQLGQGTQADASNNSSIAINKTGTGALINLQTDGNDIFRLDASGSITLGNNADHAITVADSSTGAGRSLSLVAGSTTDTQSGGDIVVQAGNSSGAAGGDIHIDAGSGTVGGSIVIGDSKATSVAIGNVGSSTTIKGSLSTDSISLGDNSNNTAGELKLASGGGFTGNISTSNLTANRNYSLPDRDGTICIEGSADCGFILTSPSSAQAGNIWLSGGASFGSGLSVRTTTNSTAAFQVQNASGKLVFGVDTENQRIMIGESDTTATLLVLDSKTDAGDPTGVNGAMYYNVDRGKMRCYENGAWENCLSNTKGAPTSKTSNYTADYGDFVIADSTSGAFTITLPSPRAGAVITVKKINAGNSITVTPSGTGVQIDNLSSVGLSSQWVSQDFYSDGVRWYRV